MSAFGVNASICDTITFFNLLAILIGVLYCLVVRPCMSARQSANPQSALDAQGTGPRTVLVATRDSAAEVIALEEGVETNSPGNTPATGTVALPKPESQGATNVRSAYIDNLKVFLTQLVVLHHIACTFSIGDAFSFNVSIARGANLPGAVYSIDNGFAAVFALWFTGVNQSYFMALFFFISGYFVPSSFDKKGRATFLKDKFQRLGIPVLAWFFVLGPLHQWSEAQLLLNEGQMWFDDSYKNTWFVGGPPWFILWLLNMSVIYGFSQGDSLSLSAPSVGMVFVVAFVCGIVQYVVPSTDFVQVPMGLNQLVLCVIFFCSGIVAKRNKWLDQFAKLDMATVWFVRGIAVACMVTLLVFIVEARKYLVVGAVQYIKNADIATFITGFMSVIMSFAELQFFEANFKSAGRLMKWASSSAYAVYLIHPPFVVFGAALWIQIVKHFGHDVTLVSFDAVEGHQVAPVWIIDSDNVVFMWLGFAFTGLFCSLVLWPLAFCLTKLPGLRLVL